MSELVDPSLTFTSKQVSTLLSKTPGMMNQQKDSTSSVKAAMTFSYTWADIQRLLNNFYYNQGVMSDGTTIRISGNVEYIRISTGLNLWTTHDIKHSLVTANERAIRGLPIFFVYLNGLKVPDTQVYLYITDSNTDILVPQTFLKPNLSNNFFIEMRTFAYYPYLELFDGASTGLKSFGLTTTNVASVSALENQYIQNNPGQTVNWALMSVLYVNGVLWTGASAIQKNISNGVVIFNITLGAGATSVPVGASVEMFVDPGIVSVSGSTMSKNGEYILFAIPNSIQSPSEGPIPTFSCQFFVNGRRIDEVLVSQQGLLHYQVSVPVGSTGVLIVTEQNFIHSSYKYYGSDYFLYNMVGSDGITAGLGGYPVNSYLDTFVNYRDILSDNGVRFLENTTDQLLNEYNSKTNFIDRVQTILTMTNNNSFRNFLNLYNKNEQTYSVAYNGTDAYVYVGVNIKVEIGENVYYDIIINRRHVPCASLKLVKRGLNQNVGIPGYYFNAGLNTMTIGYHSDSKRPFKPLRVGINNLSILGSDYIYSIPAPTGVLNPEDITVLMQSSGVLGVNYLPGGVGYNVIPGLTISIVNSVVNFTFPISSIGVLSEVVVYSKKFVYQVSTSVKYVDGETVGDLFIPISFGAANDPLPILSSGKITVYAGGVPLQEGLDYFYRTPEETPYITYSAIVILNRYYTTTSIDIYFTGVQNEVVLAVDGPYDNPYGLIYLSKLPFPFDKGYMTLKVNGFKLLNSDYDVISDKMIRIFNVTNPIQNITVETEFTEDYDVLVGSVSGYTPNSFETRLATLFSDVDYTISNRGFSGIDSTAVYASFASTVDSRGGALNQIGVSINDNRVDPYIDAYLLWLVKSGQVKASICVPHWMSQLTMNQFVVYLQKITSNRDVVVGPNLNLLSDIVFNENNYLVNYSDRIKYFANWFKTYGGPLGQAYTKYKNSKDSNVLYEWDLVPLTDVHHRLDKDIVIGYEGDAVATESTYQAAVIYTEVDGTPGFRVYPLTPTQLGQDIVDMIPITPKSYDITRCAPIQAGKMTSISSIAIHDGVFYVTPTIYTPNNADSVSSIVSFDGDSFDTLGSNLYGMMYKDAPNFLPKIFSIREIDENGNMLIAAVTDAAQGTNRISDTMTNDMLHDSEAVLTAVTGGTVYEYATPASPPSYAIYNIKSKSFRRRFSRIVANSKAPLLRTVSILRNGMSVGMIPSANTLVGYKYSNEDGVIAYDTEVGSPAGVTQSIITTNGQIRRLNRALGYQVADESKIYSMDPHLTAKTPAALDTFRSSQILLTKDGHVIRQTFGQITIDADILPRDTIQAANTLNPKMKWNLYPNMYKAPSSTNLIIDMWALSVQQNFGMFGVWDHLCAMDYDIERKIVTITFDYNSGSSYGGCVRYDVRTKKTQVFLGLPSYFRGLTIQTLQKTIKYDFSQMDLVTSIITLSPYAKGIFVWGRRVGSNIFERIYSGSVPNAYVTASFNNSFAAKTINKDKVILQFAGYYTMMGSDGGVGNWNTYPKDVVVDSVVTPDTIAFIVSKSTAADDGTLYYLNGTTFNPIILTDAGESVRSVWSDHGGIYVLTASSSIGGVFLYRMDTLFNRLWKNRIQVTTTISTYNNTFSTLYHNMTYSTDSLKIVRSKNEFLLYDNATSQIYRSGDGAHFVLIGTFSTPMQNIIFPFYRSEFGTTVPYLRESFYQFDPLIDESRLLSADGTLILKEINNMNSLTSLCQSVDGLQATDLSYLNSMRPFLVEGMLSNGLNKTSPITFFQNGLDILDSKTGIDATDYTIFSGGAGGIAHTHRVGGNESLNHRIGTKFINANTALLGTSASYNLPQTRLDSYGLYLTYNSGIVNTKTGTAFVPVDAAQGNTPLVIALGSKYVLFQAKQSASTCYLLDRESMSVITNITPFNYATSSVITLAGGALFLINGNSLYSFNENTHAVNFEVNLSTTLSTVAPSYSMVYPIEVDYSNNKSFLIYNSSANPLIGRSYYRVTINSPSSILINPETSLNNAVASAGVTYTGTQNVVYSQRSDTYWITNKPNFWPSPSQFVKGNTTTPGYYEVLYQIGGSPSVNTAKAGFIQYFQQIQDQLFIFSLRSNATSSNIDIFTIDSYGSYNLVRTIPAPWDPSAGLSLTYADVSNGTQVNLGAFRITMAANGSILINYGGFALRYYGSSWVKLTTTNTHQTTAMDPLTGSIYLMDRTLATITKWVGGSNWTAVTNYTTSFNVNATFLDAQIVTTNGIPNWVALISYSSVMSIVGFAMTVGTKVETGYTVTGSNQSVLDVNTLMTPIDELHMGLNLNPLTGAGLLPTGPNSDSISSIVTASRHRTFLRSDGSYISFDPVGAIDNSGNPLTISGFADGVSPLQPHYVSAPTDAGGALLFQPLFLAGGNLIGFVYGETDGIQINPLAFPYLAYKSYETTTQVKLVKHGPHLIGTNDVVPTLETQGFFINPNNGIPHRLFVNVAKDSTSTYTLTNGMTLKFTIVVVQESGDELIDLLPVPSSTGMTFVNLQFPEEFISDNPLVTAAQLTGTIILSTDLGVFYSTDNGVTWALQGTSNGLVNPSVYSAVIDIGEYLIKTPAGNESTSGTAILVTDQGVFYSGDNMQTWTQDTNGVFQSVINSFYTVPS